MKTLKSTSMALSSRETPAPEAVMVEIKNISNVIVTWSRPAGLQRNMAVSYELHLYQDGRGVKRKEAIATESTIGAFSDLELEKEHSVKVYTVVNNRYSKSAFKAFWTEPAPRPSPQFKLTKPDCLTVSWVRPRRWSEDMRFKVTWDYAKKQRCFNDLQQPQFDIQDLPLGENHRFTVTTVDAQGTQNLCASGEYFAEVPEPNNLTVHLSENGAMVTWSEPRKMNQAAYLLKLKYGNCAKTIITEELSVSLPGTQLDNRCEVHVYTLSNNKHQSIPAIQCFKDFVHVDNQTTKKSRWPHNRKASSSKYIVPVDNQTTRESQVSQVFKESQTRQRPKSTGITYIDDQATRILQMSQVKRNSTYRAVTESIQEVPEQKKKKAKDWFRTSLKLPGRTPKTKGTPQIGFPETPKNPQDIVPVDNQTTRESQVSQVFKESQTRQRPMSTGITYIEDQATRMLQMSQVKRNSTYRAVTESIQEVPEQKKKKSKDWFKKNLKLPGRTPKTKGTPQIGFPETPKNPQEWTFYLIAPRKSQSVMKWFQPWLKNKSMKAVNSLERCDFILAICLIVSRIGTDVEAVRRLIPDTRPSILMVMHHTFNPEMVVPDSKRFAKGYNTLLVDFLYHEDEGLLNCEKNRNSFNNMIQWIKEHIKVTQV
ncbi:uncharacterized protein LOC134060213 isoform X2 [Sardina pilchardus]|uniref:uncharacterized protein LOC134060213 isoform X2 n=1 Tax=Sardina pilchardus TaxID=27697 RepID=UPI002E1231CD